MPKSSLALERCANYGCLDCNSTPPHYVKSKQVWLRLGRLALLGVLAALASVGGMLFPDVKDAAAQRAQNGYTYTQRVCQEIGQQPRHYQVRDPIPGSDWRNDGGWAIVLETSGHFQETQYEIFNVRAAGGSGFKNQALGSANGEFSQTRTNFTFPRRHVIKGTNRWGLVTGWGVDVVVDINRDGRIGLEDIFWDTGINQHRYYLGSWRVAQEAYNYGTSYIRWANMLWCR